MEKCKKEMMSIELYFACVSEDDKDIVNTMKKQVLILKEGRLVAFKEKGGYDDEAVQNARA